MSGRWWAVKVKGEGDKVWRFVTPNGGETRLRVHAALMDEDKAKRAAEWMAENNEGFAFRAVML